jgi:MFS transporter, SP family, arabinose:H+ symporter
MSNSTADRGTTNTFGMAFVASIGGFLFGYDLGLISAANVYLRDQFNLSDAEFGFATASAVLGCVVGPTFGFWLCDAISRKRTMLIAAALLAISAVFTAFPDWLSDGSRDSVLLMFNLFRFVGGVGVGLCSVASPLYIAEIAPASKRGKLGLMYQLAIVLGNAVAPLIAYAIVYFLRVQYNVTDSAIPENPWLQAWRWMFFSEMVCILPFVMFVVGLPFSPRWLAEKGRFDEARAVLTSVDGPEHAERELLEIKANLQLEQGSWKELFSPGIRYALLIGILLTFFNNWTGWSVIGGYVPRLLELAGFSRESAIGNYVFVYGAMGVTTILSMMLTDRVGRRPLWQFASVLMAIITGVMGYMFYREVSGWPVLILLGLVTIPHGIALGGLPWVMMSEIFPTRIRAKAVSITTTCLWIFIFCGAYLFPLLTGFSQRHFLTHRHAIVTGETISIVDTDPPTINDSEARFFQAGFRPGDQISVFGGDSAQGHGEFVVADVAPGTLTLEGNTTITPEEPGSEITVQVGSVGGAFWLFSLVCLLSFLFGVTIMPETKGRSLEEIGSSWSKRQSSPAP